MSVAGKWSFSNHRQGFSLTSLVKKKGLARVVDPVNITVWTSADGKHTTGKGKADPGRILCYHKMLMISRENAHFTITCEWSAATSQHSAAHRVLLDIQCRSSQTVGCTLSSH